MAQFVKGNKGGPGRPRGSRNKRTLILENLAHDAAPGLLQALIDRGLQSSDSSAQFILSRIWPARRGPLPDLRLPAIATPAGLVRAQAALMAAIGRRDLSAEEALPWIRLMESQRAALETLELQKSIDELQREDREQADKEKAA